MLGTVVADEIEVRYAFSGKVATVKKRRGDVVKKGEVLAVLDTKLLQMELDLQLADYERRRAEFEIFNKKNTGGDDFVMFSKKIEQAQLNSSVREVEMAKAKLDLAVLTSPVNGMVVDDGGNRVGLNISPASNAFKILDLDFMTFRVEMNAKEAEDWLFSGKVKAKIAGREIAGKFDGVFPDGARFVVDVILDNWEGLAMGMTGEVWVKED